MARAPTAPTTSQARSWASQRSSDGHAAASSSTWPSPNRASTSVGGARFDISGSPPNDTSARE
jgi:hypothetical protein